MAKFRIYSPFLSVKHNGTFVVQFEFCKSNYRSVVYWPFIRLFLTFSQKRENTWISYSFVLNCKLFQLIIRGLWENAVKITCRTFSVGLLRAPQIFSKFKEIKFAVRRRLVQCVFTRTKAKTKLNVNGTLQEHVRTWERSNILQKVSMLQVAMFYRKNKLTQVDFCIKSSVDWKFTL